MKKTKKILAGLMAAASLVVGISGMSASAYTPQKNWNILVTPEAPDNPGQHRTYTCTIDKFGVSAPMRFSSNFAVDSHPKKQGAISSNFAGMVVPFFSSWAKKQTRPTRGQVCSVHSDRLLSGRGGCAGHNRRRGGCWSRGPDPPSFPRSGS